MRINHRIASVVATAALTLGLGAGVAGAQEELKLNQVGAALALPLITDHGFARTYATITNVGASDRNLHFNVINGDGWDVTDFDCPVTASETILVTWSSALLAPSPVADEVIIKRVPSTLTVECNYGGLNPLGTIVKVFDFSDGILFISNETHECKDGSCTTTENDLFGDFVVVNALQGAAYSSGAIPFQGKNPLAEGVSDRDYKFDNDEYSMFPATLASNFIAPGPNRSLDANVTAHLILFTLDGRANIGSQAALDIVFFDDDETPTSAHYTLDCFDIVALEDIDPNFLAPFLGSDAGHFYATVIDADQYSNVHDNKFGNGNAIRVVGVHGWLVQGIWANDDDANWREACPAFETCGFQGSTWSRTLSQGMLPQDLDGNDVPTFDGL